MDYSLEFNEILKNDTIFLIGSGESVPIVLGNNIDLLKNRITMCLNSSYELLDNPTYIAWSDFTWLKDNQQILNEYTLTTLINFTNNINDTTPDIDPIYNYRINKVKVEGFEKLNTTKYNVNGNNTGSRALNFLTHFKPNNIILLGFDLQGSNWHKAYSITEQKYHDSFLINFQDMADDIKRLGINVYNASTPKLSRLDCFEFTDIKEWLYE